MAAVARANTANAIVSAAPSDTAWSSARTSIVASSPSVTIASSAPAASIAAVDTSRPLSGQLIFRICNVAREVAPQYLDPFVQLGFRKLDLLAKERLGVVGEDADEIADLLLA